MTVQAIDADLLDRQHAYEAREPGWEQSYGYRLRTSVYDRELLQGHYGPFGVYADNVLANGWNVLPQERGGDRKPASVHGRTLEWRRWQTQRIPRDEVDYWQTDKTALKSNVAIVMGTVSGNAFAIDIDVTDATTARRIEKVALETLGMTLRRVGNAPKVVLLYQAPDADSVPRKRAYHLADADGGKSKHAVEILGQGSLVTGFGFHHSTGQMFEWTRNQSPANSTPDDLIVVSPEQLQCFLDRVEAEVGPFWRDTRSVSEAAWTAGFEEVHGDVRMPRIHVEFPRDAAGLISDDRERYVYSLCRAVVRRNANTTTTPEDRSVLVGRVCERFAETASTAGRWSALYVRTVAHEKVTRFSADLAAGRLSPMTKDWTPSKVVAEPVKAILPEGYVDVEAALRWLPSRQTETSVVVLRAAADHDPLTHALPIDPTEESERVSRETDVALEERLRSILWHSGEGDAPAHLLIVPTGGGKTSRAISTIKRLLPEYRREHPDQPLGLLFAVPSHANAGEALTRAQEEDLVAEANDAGLRAMTFRGKLQPGMCEYQEKIRALSDAGIGSGGVCAAKVKSQVAEGGFLEIVCPVREAGACAYWAQVAALQEMDVVFVPHAYLGLGDRMPKPLQEFARAVIVDEDISGTCIHAAAMPMQTLTLPRKPPRLTKAERLAGVVSEDHLAARHEASCIVLPELEAGRDPAAALLAKGADGLDLIESAIVVTSRSDQIEANITPQTSMASIEEVCGKLMGSHIRQEAKFWKLLRERFLSLQLDQTAAVEGNATKVAKGDTDARIRRVRRWIRLAWLSAPALQSLPVLHMDATAEPRIVRKIVGRPVEPKRIAARVRQITTLVPDATYSKSSLLCRKGEKAAVIVAKGKRIERIREAIAAICMRHADGMVLCVVPMALEAHLTGLGRWPSNLSFMHYGATKGLDWAKDAVALISVGDLNARLEDYDDLAAAITHDEDRPEAPMVMPDGSSPPYTTVEETVQMRDGRLAKVNVNRLDGEVSATFQRLIRDHELVQAWGRLRPVHRLSPGFVYHLGRTVPEGTILDAVIALKDLTRGTAAVATALVDGEGAVLEEDVQTRRDPSLETQFAALRKAVEADPTLHPGLSVVRDLAGQTAVVTATMPMQTTVHLSDMEFDLSSMTKAPEKAKTDADLQREEADQERRAKAVAELLRFRDGMLREMVRDRNGMFWLPAWVPWGTDRKGNPCKPVPMTLAEAIEAARPAPLEAIEKEEMTEAA